MTNQRAEDRPEGCPRILLVEDEHVVREHLVQVLSKEYMVDTAADGEQALRAVLRARPDLVVTDLVMPGLDGTELVRLLRGAPSTATIPILMISGRAPERVRIEGFEFGADSYLQKPYTERELRARIASMLQSARLRTEAAQRAAQAEAERRAVGERASLLESITDAFYAVDRQWRFTYINQRALDYHGKRRDELLGKVLWDVLPEHRGTLVQRRFEQAMATQQPVAFEAVAVSSHGWLDVHAYPSASGLAVNFRDISDRKRAEALLRDSELRFRSMSDAVPVLIWRSDPENNGTWFNRPWLEFTGRTLEQELGAGWADVLHPYDRERALHTCQSALARREPLEMEVRLRRHDGEYRWMLDRGAPVFDGPDGAFTGYIGTCVDISERKRAEEARRQSEERYRAFVASSSEAIWRYELREPLDLALPVEQQIDHLYRHAYLAELNDAMARMYGFDTADEMVGAPLAQTLPPDDGSAQAFLRRLLEARNALTEMESTEADRHGRIRHFSNSIVPVVENGKLLRVWGTQRDITDRRVAEERVRENERRLATEVEAMTRLHELVNRLLVCTELGAALQEVLSATITLLGAEKGNVQLLNRQTQCLEIVAQRGFAQEFLDHFRSVAANDGSACARTLLFGGRVIIEDVELDPEFAPHRDIAARAGFRAVQSTPLRSRRGEMLGVLSTHFREPHRPSEHEQRLTDLYTRQAVDFIERMRIEEALREGERRKDVFLATLAHELRNPLAPIRNGLEILRVRASVSDSALQTVLNMMERQTAQLIRLVDDLLDINRITRGKLELRREKVLLTDVVSAAVEASTHLIERHEHQLDIKIGAKGLMVDGDPTRLAQVFGNLLSNSAKYTDSGGKISLTVDQADKMAVVKVTDNGLGIPPEALDTVFGMFSQVGAHGVRAEGGLGIGLALVRTLVEMHGGTVTALSDGLGKGSTFVVRLPVVDAPVVPAKDPFAADFPPARVGKRRVLVVDDYVDAAQSFAMILELEGCDVRVAGSGEQAIELVREFGPDVVFMDIGMPEMDGLEATRRIRALPRGQNILIVALTGWGQEADRQLTNLAGFDHHLVKPVTGEALLNVLSTLKRPLVGTDLMSQQ